MTVSHHYAKSQRLQIQLVIGPKTIVKNLPALIQQIARHSCLLPIWILLKLTVERGGVPSIHTHIRAKTRGKKKKIQQ